MSGTFEPFRYRAFAIIWSANFISLLGTWMNEVGAGWLMATLNPSPGWVAMVESATTLPVLLLALPAGALADLVDRRRLIIAGQSTLAIGAGIFAVLVHLELVTPWSLLLFAFFLGTGLAFYAPARNAVVPELVPRETLHAAVVLNSVGVNLARALGPALAGFLIAWTAIVTPFALNALSFTALIFAYLWWRPTPRPPSTVPREAVLGAIGTGIRFARASAPMRAALIRAGAFFLFASAYWAMLPLVAKTVLGGGSELYGILLGCIGAGAVGGALLLPRLRPLIGSNGVMNAAALVLALALAAFAIEPHPVVAVCASLAFGAAWVLSLSLLNASAQLVLPDWVRARGMSILLSVFFGARALGSAFWGQVADATGIREALLISAAGSVLALLLVRRFRVAERAAEDVAPVGMPVPQTEGEVPLGQGPVLITIEYRVAPESAHDFMEAVCELATARRRLGAYNWGVYEDAARPGHFIETYMEPTWASHLRHHARVSQADHDLRRRVHDLVLGEHRPPRVAHYVPPRVSWKSPGSVEPTPPR